jgi:hypothetical protein
MQSSKRKVSEGNGAHKSAVTEAKQTKLEENSSTNLLSGYLEEEDFKAKFSGAFRYFLLWSKVNFDINIDTTNDVY